MNLCKSVRRLTALCVGCLLSAAPAAAQEPRQDLRAAVGELSKSIKAVAEKAEARSVRIGRFTPGGLDDANAGDGSFEYTTLTTGLGAISLLHSGWGARFLDYDNDGWKDLFIVQSHVMDTIQVNEPHLHYLESPLLLWNDHG